MFYGLLQGSALPATREHCGGGKMPGGMGHAALQSVRFAAGTVRASAPTVTMPFPVGRGALTPPPGRHPPCVSPVGVGVPDDPCPLPPNRSRPGNDTHSANVISRYADPPFRNSSASITAYRAALSCSQS